MVKQLEILNKKDDTSEKGTPQTDWTLHHGLKK